MSTTKRMGRPAAINVRALGRQMELLAGLESRITGKEPDRSFLANAKATGMGIFRLVVMGEIKKGKSSFINALVGARNLVPVHSDVATSTIFKIHHGPEVRYTVYFRPETQREKRVLNAAELIEYGTEDGNPGNTKGVDFIRVEAPSPLLSDGLVIVDTPGVGGLFKAHREITFRHAPNADAVFFVTDSVESPIGADEVKFLKELRQITPRFYFVQTKASSVDGDARAARMANNLEILERQVGLPRHEINYFIVDSHLKLEADQHRDPHDLEDSGFGPLMVFLNQSLRADHDRNVAKTGLSRAVVKLGPLLEELERRRGILDADTDSKRAALDSEAKATQLKLEEWEKSGRPRVLEEFRKGMSRLSQRAKDGMSPIRPGGKLQADFEAELNEVGDLDSLKRMIAGVEADLAALTSQACLKVMEEFRKGVEGVLEELGGSTVKSLDLIKTEIPAGELWVHTGSLGRISRRDAASGFANLQTNLIGAGVGMTVMSIAGGIIGSVIPVVGTIAGSVVGTMIAGVWGAMAAGSLKDSKELEALKRESCAAVQQAMSSAYQSAMDRINELVSEVQHEAASALQRIVTEAAERLRQQREDLAKRQKATQGELTSQRKELEALAKAAEELRTAFDAASAKLAS